MTDIQDHHLDETDETYTDQLKKIIELKKILPHPKVALVVPMTSLRQTLKKVFRNVKGLSSSMVIGPTEVSRNEYDILLVDESHRLRQRIGLTSYGSYDNGYTPLPRSLKGDWKLSTSLDETGIVFTDNDSDFLPKQIKNSYKFLPIK